MSDRDYCHYEGIMDDCEHLQKQKVVLKVEETSYRHYLSPRNAML